MFNIEGVQKLLKQVNATPAELADLADRYKMSAATMNIKAAWVMGELMGDLSEAMRAVAVEEAEAELEEDIPEESAEE